jgi:acetoacetate decarboxylase
VSVRLRAEQCDRVGQKNTPTRSLEIVKDTLIGTIAYGGQLVAIGTMGYKHESMAGRQAHHGNAFQDPGQS